MPSSVYLSCLVLPFSSSPCSYLPNATVAFVDEIFKANSAILNTLLTLLNERLFDNGAVRVAVPLLCLVRTARCPAGLATAPCLVGH
jgi:hypothetical protein